MFSIQENTRPESKRSYVGWENVPEGYYTKTTLRRDKKLKPIDESKPDDFVSVFVRELFAWNLHGKGTTCITSVTVYPSKPENVLLSEIFH